MQELNASQKHYSNCQLCPMASDSAARLFRKDILRATFSSLTRCDGGEWCVGGPSNRLLCLHLAALQHSQSLTSRTPTYLPSTTSTTRDNSSHNAHCSLLAVPFQSWAMESVATTYSLSFNRNHRSSSLYL
jgi:hypothetical protein